MQAEVRQRRLRVHLLRKHVTAESDAAVESHGREIGALAALHFGPRLQSRNNTRERRADEVQQAEIGIDGAETPAIFWALRAEIEQLNDARVVFAGGDTRDAGDVANLSGEGLLDRSSYERAAVRDKELKKGRRGKKEYEGSH